MHTSRTCGPTNCLQPIPEDYAQSMMSGFDLEKV